MTPEEIKVGHTYELTSGTHWTVKSFTADGRSIIITDGEVTTFDTPRNFARYAVRNITPAPESDQGEKVAQAQSQVASRGDGVATIPAATGDAKEGGWTVDSKLLFAISEETEMAGEHASAESVEVVIMELASRGFLKIGSATPPVAAVNAELLAVVRRFVAEWDATWTDPDDISHEWAELYRQAKAVIARAESGTPRHPRFRHKRTGDIYELLLIANEHAERTAQYPPTAVYRRVSDLTVWSRPVQDWGKDFEEVSGE